MTPSYAPSNAARRTMSRSTKRAVVFRMIMPGEPDTYTFHPAITYGSREVPRPDTTPFARVKPASPSMTIGSWGARNGVWGLLSPAAYVATTDSRANPVTAALRSFRAFHRPEIDSCVRIRGFGVLGLGEERWIAVRPMAAFLCTNLRGVEPTILRTGREPTRSPCRPWAMRSLVKLTRFRWRQVLLVDRKHLIRGVDCMFLLHVLGYRTEGFRLPNTLRHWGVDSWRKLRQRWKPLMSRPRPTPSFLSAKSPRASRRSRPDSARTSSSRRSGDGDADGAST